MALHPQYLESFLRTQHYILHMDGPLPLPYRHYIAIMALLKSGEQCWSLAELVQAVVLLAHCHSLCSFVFGCDTDLVALSKSPNGTPPAFCPFDAANGNTSVPQSLTTPNEHSVDSSGDVLFLKERIHKPQDECEKRDERFLQTGDLHDTNYLTQLIIIFTSNQLTGFHCVQQERLADEEAVVCWCADLSRFITDPDFCYQEFARREDDQFQVFRVQDYSWEDHGFSLVNRLYSDIGHLLDDRFRSVTSLPSLLSPDLKRAVWNYIHCVLGIRYDDYDYGEVNHLLERDLKLYIKTVACFPDATKTPIQVILLIMEARLQAELLYALRAITQYMIA
uniref:Sestrin-3-like n=1 Tax=Gouania willdenowi TaxID=441366 RepID=A0A8C5ECZ3_GOUWI